MEAATRSLPVAAPGYFIILAAKQINDTDSRLNREFGDETIGFVRHPTMDDHPIRFDRRNCLVIVVRLVLFTSLRHKMPPCYTCWAEYLRSLQG